MAGLFEAVLSQPIVGRIRRNHGLEHATIHVLTRRKPGRRLAGHSDAGGFWIVGEASSEEVAEAVHEALSRLRRGERQLAVHPNCGTNLVTAGIAAGLAGAMAMIGVGGRKRDKLERLPLAATLATVALMAAQPLGTRVQERVTTSGEPGALEVVEIRRSQRGRMTAHRIVTRG